MWEVSAILLCSENSFPPDPYRIHKATGLKLEFSDNSSQSTFELSSIIVDEPNILFEITGIHINVGNNIVRLNHFNRNGDNNSFIFKNSESQNHFLERENYIIINFNSSNIVTKIELVVF